MGRHNHQLGLLGEFVLVNTIYIIHPHSSCAPEVCEGGVSPTHVRISGCSLRVGRLLHAVHTFYRRITVRLKGLYIVQTAYLLLVPE